ncbi:MAG: DUF4157 domain-containing protein [Kofleriaceae bacterium]|nr:DUF4157 domain-containing protein [Kofleriaceae bacterium]
MFDIAPALQEGLATSIEDPAPKQQVASAGQTAASGFQGPGSSIPYQAEMEQSFGRDFSAVRAHTDQHASAASASLGAHAYAMGNEIAFANSNPSKDLVAHELTHVLQYQDGGGNGMQAKSAGAGIDTSGEEEAEKVQLAVKEGRPARSALEGGVTKGGGPQLKAGKGIARSGHGGGHAPFTFGMTFSPEAFEKTYEYPIWHHGGITAPIAAVPGLNFILRPEAKIVGAVGANWAHKAFEAKLNVLGAAQIGLSYGAPDLAEVYGVLEPRIEGGFVYKKYGGGGGAHAAPAAEGHHEPAAEHHAPANEHAGAQQGGEHAAGHAKSWSLDGGLNLYSMFRVGVKFGGGWVDWGFDFGHCEIGKLTGLSWKDGHFDASAVGWEWGAKPKEFFAAVHQGIEKVKALGRMGREAFENGMETAKRNLQGLFNAGAQAAEWFSSW